MKKILPLAQPIADSYAHVGMEFAMFLTDEKYYPWIINNFIQIYSLKNMHMVCERTGTLDYCYNIFGDWQLFEFSANPYLEYEKISYSILNTITRFISLRDLIKSALNDNKYIFLPIDAYVIPCYGFYQKNHHIHHILISGYDDNTGTVLASDNFYEGKFQTVNLEFSVVEEGYRSLFLNHLSEWSESGGMSMFRFYQKPWHKNIDELYKINHKIILSGIKEYLMLPEYCDRYRNVSYYHYGIDCYQDLIGWLNFGISTKECNVDHRAFSAMRDHKKVMVFRFEYLQKYFNRDLQEYISTYKAIVRQMNRIIMKILKGNIAKDKNKFIECLTEINKVKEDEVKILNKYISYY